MINLKSYQSSSAMIVQNKRAKHEFFIEREIEAGLSLQGWEVKSLRFGRANITSSYVYLKNNEAYLFGATFQPLLTVSSHVLCDSTRTRKLLLNKRELLFLHHSINCKGYSAIILFLYWKKLWIKVKIGIAKGKKEYDKRIDIKKHEWNLNRARIMKHSTR